MQPAGVSKSLTRSGFEERTKGSHHIFYREGIEEIINLQKDDGQAKPYLASVADYFSRSEYIVDIFAAGPDIYEVSAGRSLAYLENILDVLACIESCHEPPFEVVGPALFEKLEQITSVVVVVQDWDDARETFLRRVKAFGVDLRILLVRDGPTTKDWQLAGEELGELSVMRPVDVERALANESA